MIPVVHLAAVPDELEAANHFADGEEAEALGEQDAAGGRLGSCDVAQLLGVGGLDDAVEEPGRVLELLDQVLVVGLEGLEGAIERQKCQFLVVGYYSGARKGGRTEESCSGPWRPAWRVPGRPWSSRRRWVFGLEEEEIVSGG
jgi:hypothetical protein